MSELKWQDAIVKILEESDNPLHYAEIAEQIIEQGLRENVGATPANAVGSYITSSIKNEGDASPFERVTRGVYRLRRIDSVLPDETRSQSDVVSVREQDEEGEDTSPICAFGMYWRRDKVSWDRSSMKLLGQQYKGSDVADFEGQQGVYLLHDGREVIYVGRATSQRLGLRLKEHTKDRLDGRWDRFSWFGVSKVDEDGTLIEREDSIQVRLEDLIAAMESLLIEGLEPRQNRKRGDGFEAIEFLQVVDPDIVRKEQEMILEKMKSAL